MDDRHFDSLTKALAKGASRRSVIKGLLGLGGTALAGSVALDGDIEAARRPTPAPKPHTCPGVQTWNGSACVCPHGLSQCNPDGGPTCCNDQSDVGPGYSECCDNACCQYPYDCVGEEQCCRRLPEVGCLDSRGRCCTTLCQEVPSGVECCPTNDFCPGGSETPNLCCTGNTICCGGGTNTNHCIPSDQVCCTLDTDCAYLNRCDGLTWHHFVCGEGGYCIGEPQSCGDDLKCTNDTCDAQTGCGHSDIQCTTPPLCFTGPGECNPDTGQRSYPPLCSGDTPQCCQADDTSYCCIPDNAACCNNATPRLSDCQACGQDGYCVSICNSEKPDCCPHTPDFCVDKESGGCCGDGDCDPVDLCTPADCLDTNLCRTSSICGAGETCGGGGIDGQCGCTPNVTEENCDGVTCGDFPDGCGGTVACGCSDPNTCGGGGTDGQCGCTPTFTEEDCVSCGEYPDGCGGTVACGCSAGTICGAEGSCVTPDIQAVQTSECRAQAVLMNFPPNTRLSTLRISGRWTNGTVVDLASYSNILSTDAFGSLTQTSDTNHIDGAMVEIGASATIGGTTYASSWIPVTCSRP